MSREDIRFRENIVRKNRIPILIYTPEWLQLFNNYRSKDMEKSIDKLEEQLSLEKQYEAEQKELEHRKKILLNKILVLSNKANEHNDHSALDKMAEAQQELLNINKRMPEIIEELEVIPGRINMLNTELLKITIKRAYDIINDHKIDSEKTQIEINEMREKLGNLIQKKVDIEERINRLYSFVHGMVGAENMESLDDSFLNR